MKKFRFISIALISAFALLTAACQKEITSNDEIYRPAGSKIVFTVLSGYDNGVETKAEYSGVLYGTSQKRERIDWVTGDPIKIIYNENSDSDGYTVTGTPTADDANSKAKITGNLVWKAGPHYFYALYPNNSNGSISVDNKVATVTGKIPADQSVSAVSTVNGVPKYQPHTAEYGFMVGYKYIENSSTVTTVELPFKPAVTTFEFKLKLKEGMPAVKIKKAELFSQTGNVGADMTGNFALSFSDGNDRGATWGTPTVTGNAGRSIVIEFPGEGAAFPTDGNYLDFSFLALPINQKALTLKLTYDTGATKLLKLKDNMTAGNSESGTWHEFAGAQKYVITNDYVPSEEIWTYYVDDIANISTYGHVATPNLGFTVKSYRKNASGTKTEAVKWKVQYSTSKDGPWSDTQPTSWTPTYGAMFSITNTSGNGSLPSVGEANKANILRNHDDSEKSESGFDSEQAAIAVLQGRGTLPSSGEGYFDLSKHPFYPVNDTEDAVDGSERARETANCYVITRPGKYKFPLVYGNAIRNGRTNEASYAPQGSSAVNDINYFLRRFVRHDDLPIVDPWLKNNGATPTDAVVVWQDVTNEDMQILLDSDISVDEDFVYFEIKSERIRPGNILLAARKNGTIVWSWHLWVTEKDLTPHHMKDKKDWEFDMMNYNLGWTDKVEAHGYHWNDWPFYVRIIQTDASGNILNSTNPQNVDSTGAADVFSVTQFGESISVDANVGSNTFYQWGRKDPMLPAASSNTNKRIYSKAYSLSDIVEGENKVVTVLNNNGTFGQSIKTPYNIFYSRNGDNHLYVGRALNNEGGSIGVALYTNLWDTGMISHKAAMDNAEPGVSHNAINLINRLPVKSVYDPCPPGFVVPYAFAFTGFSSGAWNQNWVQGSNEPHPASGSAYVSDGIEFPDGYGGRIYIPYAGARAGDGGDFDRALYDVTSTMYYWTAGKCPADGSSFHKSRTFTVLKGNPADVRAIWEQFSEGAYAIRPVVEIYED